MNPTAASLSTGYRVVICSVCIPVSCPFCILSIGSSSVGGTLTPEPHSSSGNRCKNMPLHHACLSLSPPSPYQMSSTIVRLGCRRRLPSATAGIISGRPLLYVPSVPARHFSTEQEQEKGCHIEQIYEGGLTPPVKILKRWRYNVA